MEGGPVSGSHSRSGARRAGARVGPEALFPWLLTALIFASRLPYLRPGYGSDPDAYRVVSAARALRAGSYMASRPPGYPLHEAATALFLPGGPRLVNGATAFVSALAALALFRLAEQLGLSRARATLAALAFAFTPVVFVNSVSSIDYVWSLCFVLWSAAQLVSGRSLLAGVLLGAAIGARITAGAMIVPLLLLQRFFAPRAGGAPRLCLAAAISASLCFAPVFWTYGLDILQFHDGAVSWQTALERATFAVWGSPGVYAFAGVVAIAVLARAQLKSTLARSDARALSYVVLSVLLIYGLAFVRLPLEAGYLVPCVPFLLLWLSYMLPPVATGQLASLCLLSCFASVDADGFQLDGPVLSEKQFRCERAALATHVTEQVATLPGKALVVSGALLPLIDVKLGGSEQGPHRYLYLFQNEAELEPYLRDGFALYYVDRDTERRQRRLGVALREHGAQRLR